MRPISTVKDLSSIAGLLILLALTASPVWAVDPFCFLETMRRTLGFPNRTLNPSEVKYLLKRQAEEPSRFGVYFDTRAVEANERVLFMDDPKLDRDLYEWTEKNLKNRSLDSLDDINNLAKEVHATLNRPGTPLEQYQKATRHSYLVTGVKRLGGDPNQTTIKISKMGDYIKNARGECRHEAILMSYGLKRLGLTEVKVQLGELKEITKYVNGIPVYLESDVGHTWLEFKFRGKRYLIDPTWEIEAKQMQVAEPQIIDINQTAKSKGDRFQYFPEPYRRDADFKKITPSLTGETRKNTEKSRRLRNFP